MAFHDARVFDRVSVTRLLVHDDGTWEDPPQPSADAPVESPPGWFDEVTVTLEAYDEHVRARIRAEHAASKTVQERVAGELLPQFLRDDLKPKDAEGLTLRLSEMSDPTENSLLIKCGRAAVGRYLVAGQVLFVADELQRHSVAQFLEQAGYPVREPLQGWTRPPRLVAEVDRVNLWRALRVTLGVAGDPHELKLRPMAALYFPPEQQLMCAAAVWEPHVRELLAWQGLPVLGVLEFEAPDGYDPMLYNRLPWRLQFEVAGMANSRRFRTAAPGKKPRSLRPACRRMVSPQVADAVEEILKSSQNRRFEPARPGGHRGWSHRSGS